jgi:hypothetical protein
MAKYLQEFKMSQVQFRMTDFCTKILKNAEIIVSLTLYIVQVVKDLRDARHVIFLCCVSLRLWTSIVNIV